MRKINNNNKKDKMRIQSKEREKLEIYKKIEKKKRRKTNRQQETKATPPPHTHTQKKNTHTLTHSKNFWSTICGADWILLWCCWIWSLDVSNLGLLGASLAASQCESLSLPGPGQPQPWYTEAHSHPAGRVSLAQRLNQPWVSCLKGPCSQLFFLPSQSWVP